MCLKQRIDAMLEFPRWNPAPSETHHAMMRELYGHPLTLSIITGSKHRTEQPKKGARRLSFAPASVGILGQPETV